MIPGPATATEPDPPTTPGDDLAWEAFRYVADELSPAATSRFEARLLHDQAAREAVAAAVDYLGAIAIAADEIAAKLTGSTPGRPARGRRGRFAAALLATAAGLVGAAWWGTQLILPPASADVALAWTTLRGEASGEGLALSVEPVLLDPVVGLEPASADATSADVPAERPVPSWLVAAVAPDLDPAGHSPAPEDN